MFEYERCQKENRRYTRGRRPTTFDPSPPSPAACPAPSRIEAAQHHVPVPPSQRRIAGVSADEPTTMQSHSLPPGLSPQQIVVIKNKPFCFILINV